MTGLAARLYDPHDAPPDPPRVFTRERTARKPHRCGNCTRPIRPGERYLATAAAPNGDLGNEHWQHTATHLNASACTWSTT